MLWPCRAHVVGMTSAQLDEPVYLVPSDATNEQVAQAFLSTNAELIERCEHDKFRELGSVVRLLLEWFQARPVSSGVRTKFLQSRRRTVGKRYSDLVLTPPRYAPGVLFSLQGRFSPTGLSSKRFPTSPFTGTGRMVLFDRERKIYPSPQTRRGPPAHVRSAARSYEPTGSTCFRAAIRVDIRRKRPDHQPAPDDPGHGSVGLACSRPNSFRALGPRRIWPSPDTAGRKREALPVDWRPSGLLLGGSLRRRRA